MGIGAIFFYLYTNFGVWLLWPSMYPPIWQELIQSYIMGLPFLKYNLLGNLIIIGSDVNGGVYGWQLVKAMRQKRQLERVKQES